MKIVALGELLWDLFPTGPTLGGAPANFTLHAQGLGAEARLISRVGADSLGAEALRILRERGIPVDTIPVDADAPTGTVEVAVAADGQPTYRILEHVAWDRITVTPEARAAVANADALCFGTLAQRDPRSRAAIRELLSLAKPDGLRIFDVNLRTPFWTADVIAESLALCNVVKLNEDELAVVGLDLETLRARYDLKLVALTRGANGSVLLTAEQRSEHPGIPTTVRDTVGAGDSFAAALTVGLLAGEPLPTIHDRASRVAAYVCSQPGATPLLPAKFATAQETPR